MGIISAIRDWKHGRKARKKALEWERGGKATPPPALIKQRMVRRFADQCHLKILVETGTYKGDMVKAMEKVSERIYSIELSEKFFRKAKERFRGQKHIELIHGDSGKELAFGLLPEDRDHGYPQDGIACAQYQVHPG